MKQVAELLNRLAGPDATPDRWLEVVATQGLLPYLPALTRVPPAPLLQRHGQRCLELTSELFALLDLFERHDIPRIAFKGPVLAVQLYGDPAGRSFDDLDVIVPPAHAERAVALLFTRGYEPVPKWRPFPFSWWRRSTYHTHLTRNGMTVEVHWALGDHGFAPLDMATVWSGLVPVRIGGRVVHTLSGEQLALYLAAHGTKHAWERLEWIVDYSQLVRISPGLDWSRIAAAARRRGFERALLLGLRLASEVVGVPAPQVLAPRVERDERVGALAKRVLASVGAMDSFAEQPWTRLRFFSLVARERWRDKIRYVADLAFTPGSEDWTLLRLPNALYGLYYVLRPIRLAAKYARRVVSVVRRRIPAKQAVHGARERGSAPDYRILSNRPRIRT